MLAATANALRNAAAAVGAAVTMGFRYIWDIVEWAVEAPGRMVRGVFNQPAGSVPHPASEPSADDPAVEISELVASRNRARAVNGPLPSGLDPRADGTDSIAASVHAYARALPSERGQVSIDALSPDQLAWLLRQTPDDLQRMAAAGGLVCGRLARGNGGGALGVEPCRRRERQLEEVDLTEREPEEAPRLDYGPGFAGRVARRRPGMRRAA